MLAARGVFPGSEPKDPSSPMRGITTAFGFWRTFAEGLDVDADLPGEVISAAMGGIADDLEPPTIGVGIGVDGAGGLGGTSAGGLVLAGPLIHIENFTGSDREADRLADRIAMRLRLQGV